MKICCSCYSAKVGPAPVTENRNQPDISKALNTSTDTVIIDQPSFNPGDITHIQVEKTGVKLLDSYSIDASVEIKTESLLNFTSGLHNALKNIEIAPGVTSKDVLLIDIRIEGITIKISRLGDKKLVNGVTLYGLKLGFFTEWTLREEFPLQEKIPIEISLNFRDDNNSQNISSKVDSLTKELDHKSHDLCQREKTLTIRFSQDKKGQVESLIEKFLKEGYQVSVSRNFFETDTYRSMLASDIELQLRLPEPKIVFSKYSYSIQKCLNPNPDCDWLMPNEKFKDFLPPILSFNGTIFKQEDDNVLKCATQFLEKASGFFLDHGLEISTRQETLKLQSNGSTRTLNILEISPPRDDLTVTLGQIDENELTDSQAFPTISIFSTTKTLAKVRIPFYLEAGKYFVKKMALSYVFRRISDTEVEAYKREPN